jgi:hypothetical protein
MIQAHKRKGHGVHLYCPILKKEMHLAGMLFVDDTDLEHFDITKNKTVIMAMKLCSTVSSIGVRY